MEDLFRAIPATDKCIRALLAADPSLEAAPGQTLKSLVNKFWNGKREEIKKGLATGGIGLEAQLAELLDFARAGLRPNLRRVHNATGVIVHTNLGRSVLAEEACQAVLHAARAYSSLELDLETGERGSRHNLTRSLLCELTGAEDGLVVNNNAAAVLLILDTLCAGGETIVSRGELVEIGGSFRIPDIMRKSGTTLREVGTTNRTHLEDYRSAINEQTRAIMRVHASNFRISGFHCAPDARDLKALAAASQLPLINDLGSGSLLDFAENGLPPEPTVRDAVANADLVCFSGDKALGGAQAGIIVGKGLLVEKLKKNPLARALRCDKLCLAALEATLRLYRDPEKARQAIPTAAMIAKSPKQLAKCARSLMDGIKRAFAGNEIACGIKLEKNSSRIGGGSFPECELPTTLVCIYPRKISIQQLRSRLLAAEVPLLGRMEKDAFCLDPRTLDKKDYPEIIRALVRALE